MWDDKEFVPFFCTEALQWSPQFNERRGTMVVKIPEDQRILVTLEFDGNTLAVIPERGMTGADVRLFRHMAGGDLRPATDLVEVHRHTLPFFVGDDEDWEEADDSLVFVDPEGMVDEDYPTFVKGGKRRIFSLPPGSFLLAYNYAQEEDEDGPILSTEDPDMLNQTCAGKLNFEVI